MSPAGDRSFNLAAVGDVVLARDDPADAFVHVEDLLGTTDLSCCNLEVPLSDEGLPQPGKFETLHASPAMIDGYVAAGFDIVSMANNHAMDYGPRALADTLDRLDRHGIAHVGAGLDRSQAWQPRICDAGNVTVAFASFASEAYPGFGATPNRPGSAMLRRDPLYGATGVNPDDVAEMAATVAAARETADYAVAMFHWGLSQSYSLSVSQRTLAQAAVQAGAQLVIGHHPHVVQGVEVLDGVPVCYSLGNFVFDLTPYFFTPATRDSALAVVRFGGGRALTVEFTPVQLGGDGRPRPCADGSGDGTRIFERLTRDSAALGTHFSVEDGIARWKADGHAEPGGRHGDG